MSSKAIDTPLSMTIDNATCHPHTNLTWLVATQNIQISLTHRELAERRASFDQTVKGLIQATGSGIIEAMLLSSRRRVTAV